MFLCIMKVYKVFFNGDVAKCAVPAPKLKHGEVALSENSEKVIWYAIECRDIATALEVAEKVVKSLWGAGRIMDRPKTLDNLAAYICKN